MDHKKNKELIENIEEAVISYLVKDHIDVGNLKFYTAEEYEERSGKKGTLGGVLFEESGLNEIINMLDRAGDFTHSFKHHHEITKIFDQYNVSLEPVSSYLASIYQR